MTGSAADADDILQETFVRLMQKPPADTEEPLRPWLVRVAVNLSRDLLRRRRRQGYVGQWLPAPFETENNDDLLSLLDLKRQPLRQTRAIRQLAMKCWKASRSLSCWRLSC